MIYSDKILIISQNGVSIYGRVIGAGGKLGRFQVYSDYFGDDGIVYFTFKEAENKMKATLYLLESRDKYKK